MKYVKMKNKNAYIQLLDLLTSEADVLTFGSVANLFEDSDIFQYFTTHFIDKHLSSKVRPGYCSGERVGLYKYHLDRQLSKFLRVYIDDFITKEIETDLYFYRGEQLLLYTVTHERMIVVSSNDFIQKIREANIELEMSNRLL